CQQVYNYPVTF
nr:immunoglobulin light chain junction region [Macaca mulatta]MOW52678.1 immunoglobulin light chain junction region [Macaca mulatta]MOW54997.1 immunoglobulin light chain junction region [Macaca mulatta]